MVSDILQVQPLLRQAGESHANCSGAGKGAMEGVGGGLDISASARTKGAYTMIVHRMV
jgi:hypothetical protein